MKANELMVGDWVYSAFSEKPCKVEGIEWTESEYAYVKVCGVDGYKCIESLSPIPLTQEILEKNGWEYDYDIDECVADGGQFITLKGYVYEEDGVLIDYCNGFVKVVTDFNGDVTKRMSYVHQIQHALRLCGIEKEIVL